MVQYNYNDILENPNLTKEQKVQAIKERGEQNNRDIMKSYAKDVARMWGGEAAELGLAAFSGSKVKYLPKMIAGLRLLYHKPFDKMSEEEYNKFGRLGMDYYKKYIQGKKANNQEVQNVDYKNRQGIMFTGKRAGEPDYRFMEQYPRLINNIENAKENYFDPVRSKIGKDGIEYLRKDAKGFSNLKVNWRGKDYDYQVRHNPYLEMPDFYNIKPYDFLIKQIEKGSP